MTTSCELSNKQLFGCRLSEFMIVKFWPMIPHIRNILCFSFPTFTSKLGLPQRDCSLYIYLRGH